MADFQVTGNIRIPNAGAVLFRDQNNAGDFTALAADSSGNLLIGHANMPNITFVTGPQVFINDVMRWRVDNALAYQFQTAGAVPVLTIDTLNDEVELGTGTALAWSTDLKLFRDGPWELALRDGLNDNFFYIYGTFTDASNYERLAVYAGSSVIYVVEPQSAGTGNNTINMRVSALGGGSMTTGSLDNSDGWHARGFNFSFWKGTPESRTFLDMSPALLSAMSGASVTAATVIPAGALILGVTVRVNTTITGPATFSIGDGVDVDRWGTGIAVAAGTRTSGIDFTSTAITVNNGAGNAPVVITSDGVPFTAGEVRVIVHYMSFFAPTTS